MFGYCSAFIGGTITLPSFEAAFGLTSSTTTDLSANIVSTFQAGAFFGVIIGTFFSERFGRKYSIVGAGLVFIIGVALHFIADINTLYVGRCITGLGVGATTVIVPVYISECAPAIIRGRLVGILEIMLVGASLCGFWVSYGVQLNIANDNDAQWYIPFAIQFIPSGFLVATMPFMVESPRWLVSRGKHTRALASLSWIRNLPAEHEYVQHELADMEAHVAHQQELAPAGKTSIFHGFHHLGDSSIRKRILVSMALMTLQNLTGVNALNYYSPTIVSKLGFSGATSKLLASGIYGVVKFVVTIAFMVFIVDAFGRRVPLIVGGLGCAATMFYLGAYTYVSNSFETTLPRDAGAEAAIACLYIYAIFYSFSWSGIPWIFASEVLPTHVRGFGMMCSGLAQWLSQFVIVYSLPYMVIGIESGMFFLFGACAAVATGFAWLCVPETKGVGVEDMRGLFEGRAWRTKQMTRKDSEGMGSDLEEGHEKEKERDIDELEVI